MNIPLVTRVRFANNEKSLLAIASADGVISVCHVECASIVPVCESPTGTEPFPAGAAAGLGPLREVRSASPTTRQQLSPTRDLDADAGALPPAALVGLGARDHSAPPSCPLPTAATATPAAATYSEAEAEAEAGAREAVVKLEMSAQSLSGDSLELEAVSPRSDSDSISPALSPTGATAAAGGAAGGHELDTRQQALAAQPPPLPQFDSISQMSFLSPSSEPALSGSSRLQSNSYVLHTLRGHTGPINGIHVLYYTSNAVSFITHTRIQYI